MIIKLFFEQKEIERQQKIIEDLEDLLTKTRKVLLSQI